MVRNTSKKDYQKLFGDERVLSRNDSTYKILMTAYRKKCSLMPLYIEANGFSGEWILNEEISEFDNNGSGNSAYKMKLLLEGDTLNIERSFIVEYYNDEITCENMPVDSSEIKSMFWNSPRITVAKLSERNDTISVSSVVTFNRDGQIPGMKSSELWSLAEDCDMLVIEQNSATFWGERKIKMIYDRQ